MFDAIYRQRSQEYYTPMWKKPSDFAEQVPSIPRFPPHLFSAKQERNNKISFLTAERLTVVKSPFCNKAVEGILQYVI